MRLGGHSQGNSTMGDVDIVEVRRQQSVVGVVSALAKLAAATVHGASPLHASPHGTRVRMKCAGAGGCISSVGWRRR